MMQNNDLTERLEAIVDASTLFDTIECLVGVCELKANHLRSAWQDDLTAKTWERAALRLDKLTYDPVIRSI